MLALMDCPLNNTFLLTFRTLVWRILQVRALTVVSCCGIFPNPSRQYSKRQTRGEEIEKCLDGGLEPTYYFSIFMHNKCLINKHLIFTSDFMTHIKTKIEETKYFFYNVANNCFQHQLHQTKVNTSCYVSYWPFLMFELK